MGYFCNNEIASVVEPSEMVLANNPNFVVFSSRNGGEADNHFRATLRVVSVGSQKQNLTIEIKEAESTKVHSFKSTYDPEEVDDNTFLIVMPDSNMIGDNSSFLDGVPLVMTAQNIRNCFLKNSFLKNNFEITMDVSKTVTEAGTFKQYLYEDNAIIIKSKGCGAQYNFSTIIKYDKVESIEADYSISLKNLDYSNLKIETFYLTLEGHSLRAAIHAPLYGDYEKNNENYFKVVLPQPGVVSESQARLETLKNIRLCMLREKMAALNLNIYLNEKEMRIDCSYIDQVQSEVLDNISSRSAMLVIEKGNTIDFPKLLMSVSSQSYSYDTIDYGTGTYRIDLDVYTDHEVYPGTDDLLPYLGNYVTTLSKSYFGQPMWFDLSLLLSKKVSYSTAFLTELELDKLNKGFKLWSNTGTITDYRFIAKRTDGVIHESFYYSSPLYALNGYSYTLNPISLEKDEEGNSYILDSLQDFYTDEVVKVKPLTTNFNRTHIKGQRQYFNFIKKYRWTTIRIAGYDDLRPFIGLYYKLYTQSGALIGTHIDNAQDEALFSKVNTALINLDQFLPVYKSKTVGRIDVYLCRWHKSEYYKKDEPEIEISTPVSFRILPEILNQVNDFAFLNQLGGWDTMNFGGSTSCEFKTSSSTIYKTLQPDIKSYSEIESVVMKNVQEQKTVQTSPITKETVEWLRQMSASPAVYELSTKRYILIDDMSLKYNSTDDLYQVEMKYHYTDTFNTKI